MTLPMVLALHLIFGASMASIMRARLLDEGRILDTPLITTLVPVVTISGPLSCFLFRYTGVWFTHGLFQGERWVIYEQWNLLFMILLVAFCIMSTLMGFFWHIAWTSRMRATMARVAYWLGGLLFFGTLSLHWHDVWYVTGTSETLFEHPAGKVSLLILILFILLYIAARRWWSRLSTAQSSGRPRQLHLW